MRARLVAFAEADQKYDVKFARQLLQAKAAGMTDVQAKAEATLACEDELLARNIASALLESLKEAGRNTRAELDSLRSINANARIASGLDS